MKKLFTLVIAAVAAMTVTAQNVELLFGPTAESAKPVKNGATYETGYVLESQQSIFYRYKQNSDLWIRGAKGEWISVEVKSDNNLNVCSIDGTCVNLNAGNNFECFKSGVLGENIAGAAEGEIVTIDALIDYVTNIRSTTGAPSDQQVMSQLKTITATVYMMGETEEDDILITVVMHNKPASEVGGVDGIIADTETADPVYFNLMGERVSEPKSGLYIVRRGSKVTKEVIR